MAEVNRIKDWKDFSKEIEAHIQYYVMPQYQNPDGDDQVQNWTPDQIMDAIKRYVTRYGKNARGNIEAIRDVLKIAHYASRLYPKLAEELKVLLIYDAKGNDKDGE